MMHKWTIREFWGRVELTGAQTTMAFSPHDVMAVTRLDTAGEPPAVYVILKQAINAQDCFQVDASYEKALSVISRARTADFEELDSAIGGGE